MLISKMTLSPSHLGLVFVCSSNERSFMVVSNNSYQTVARLVNVGCYANFGQCSIINLTFICLFIVFCVCSLVTTEVVNLPERTKSGLITGSDHTVRAVHSCNSWFLRNINVKPYHLQQSVRDLKKVII